MSTKKDMKYKKDMKDMKNKKKNKKTTKTTCESVNHIVNFIRNLGSQNYSDAKISLQRAVEEKVKERIQQFAKI